MCLENVVFPFWHLCKSVTTFIPARGCQTYNAIALGSLGNIKWTSDQSRNGDNCRLGQLCYAWRNIDREILTTVTIAPALILSSWIFLKEPSCWGCPGGEWIRISANCFGKRFGNSSWVLTPCVTLSDSNEMSAVFIYSKL